MYNFNLLTERINRLNFSDDDIEFVIEKDKITDEISIGPLKLGMPREKVRSLFPNFTEKFVTTDDYGRFEFSYSYQNTLISVTLFSSIKCFKETKQHSNGSLKDYVSELLDSENYIVNHTDIVFPRHHLFTDSLGNPSYITFYLDGYYQFERPSFELIVDKAKHCKLTDSKIGGIPYWNVEDSPYPTNSNGDPLELLCQINCEQERFSDVRLPMFGLIQFYWDPRDDGVPRENMVIYQPFPENYIDEATVLKTVRHLCPIEQDKNSPVKKEIKIHFERRPLLVVPSNSGVFVTPQFFNGNPLKLKGELTKYDTVLFTLENIPKFIEFGNPSGGSVQYFVNNKKLLKKDFKETLLTWASL